MKNMHKQMMVMVIAGALGFVSCNSQSSVAIKKIPLNYFNADNTIINTQHGITYINHKKANGYFFAVNSQKDTLLLEGYIDGKKDGACYSKYTNLQYRYIQYFTNGSMECLQRVWWANGKLKQEANYRKDVFHGRLREWSSSGMLMRDNNYVDGHEDGKQCMWYDNGKLRANYVVKNSRIYGLSGTMNCFNAVEKKLSDHDLFD